MADSSPTSPSRARIVAAYAAVYVIWGSTYLAIRFAIETLPPFMMAGVRFLVAGAILYGWSRLRGAARPSRANWVATAIVGGFLLLGGNGGVVWAEQRVESGIAALLVATLPLWMALLEWVGPDRRRPTGRTALGILLGLAGVAVLVGPEALLGGAANVDPLGALVLVLASLAWAIGSLYSRRAPMPASPQIGSGMQMLAGGALLTLLGLTTGEGSGVELAAFSTTSLAALGYLITFGSLIGFSAYVWLLRVEPTSRVATYAYVNPVVAVALGWLLAGEAMTAQTAVAAAIIVGAVALTVSAPKKRDATPAGPVHPAVPSTTQPHRRSDRRRLRAS
ncbi:MAG TPA: EamA family transporter [Gemmatimonadales bacterium]